MNWQLLPQFAITGILNGGPIALIALGLVLIFKSSEVFNFSQGQMLLFGTMATWWFAAEEGLGLPLPLAIVAALLTSVLLGMLIERLALRPLTGQPLLSILLFVLAGFPEPVVDVEVFDDAGRLRYRIDLAWPSAKVAVEYDGRHHINRQDQWTYDIRRREELEAEGWRFLVLTAPDIYPTSGTPPCG